MLLSSTIQLLNVVLDPWVKKQRYDCKTWAWELKDSSSSSLLNHAFTMNILCWRLALLQTSISRCVRKAIFTPRVMFVCDNAHFMPTNQNAFVQANAHLVSSSLPLCLSILLLLAMKDISSGQLMSLFLTVEEAISGIKMCPFIHVCSQALSKKKLWHCIECRVMWWFAKH